jgi:arylformamidase
MDSTQNSPQIRWHDVTIPLHQGMVVWPGDPEFRFFPACRISEGASCNVSAVEMGLHTGTHVDAPWHFEEDGRKLHEVDTSLFFGRAQVLHYPHAAVITAEMLDGIALRERVLFRTRNSEYPLDEPFRKDFVAISDCAAQRLVEAGVKLAGVDYLSVAPFKQPDQDTHHILLKAGVLVVEGLRLGKIAAGEYDFIVMPLSVVGADGAPCRAFVAMQAE